MNRLDPAIASRRLGLSLSHAERWRPYQLFQAVATRMTTPSATSMSLSETPASAGRLRSRAPFSSWCFTPIGFFDGHPCDRVRAGLAASRGLFNSRPDYWPAEVTRQTVFPTSSAIRSAPVLSTASPTGRPLAFPSASRKSVTTSSAFPLGRPPLKGTKTTL